MGKIITVKVNKGGVGKTFLTAQLGTGLAMIDKKVLIVTSDSQNNILNYLYNGDRSFKKGLKEDVKNGTGEFFKLRQNLEYIPLENNKFGNHFIQELSGYLTNKKEEYDFILIDSVPTMKIDDVFVKCSDKIIIPAFCDEVTIEGILNLVEHIDVNKISSIVINKYKNTETQNQYLNKLRDAVEGTSILLSEPIPQLSMIEKMLDKRKSIWEYSNKDILKIQDILAEIMQKMLEN
ncbi:MAG: ParA family protein [Fusobacteriaceae bacterium]